MTLAGSRLAALLAPPLCVAGLSACVEPAHLERQWTEADLQASAELYAATEPTAEEALAQIREMLGTARSRLDPDLPDSLLARLNREAGARPYPTENREFFRCALLALDYADFSESAFDPTAAPLRRLYRERSPSDREIERARASIGWEKVLVASEARAIGFRRPGMELDLVGIRDGCALDVAARAFAAPGMRAGFLRLGTVSYAWRSPPGRAGWDVALPDPRAPRRTMAFVEVADRGVGVAGATTPEGAVAGSGFPRRVIDPRTGRPAGGVTAAAAIAASAADAEAMSWALLVAGPGGAGAMLARTNGVEALLLVPDEDGAYLLASASLEGRLRVTDELAREVEGRVRYLLPAAD